MELVYTTKVQIFSTKNSVLVCGIGCYTKYIRWPFFSPEDARQILCPPKSRIYLECKSIAYGLHGRGSIPSSGFLLRHRVHNSSVGIALGYGLDDRGSRVRFPAGAGNFSLHYRLQNGSGAHPVSYPMGTRGSFPVGKVTGAWIWPLTSL
jgi:hypothetical protein